MQFLSRVNVYSASGRWMLAVHSARAQSMVRNYEARYQDSRSIVLEQTARVTAEMARGPIPQNANAPKGTGVQFHASHHRQLHSRGGVKRLFIFREMAE